MDNGSIAEVSRQLRCQHADLQFDTPLTLFDTPGSIFRGLCDTKVGPWDLGGC